MQDFLHVLGPSAPKERAFSELLFRDNSAGSDDDDERKEISERPGGFRTGFMSVTAESFRSWLCLRDRSEQK